jgi:hypothetical protein
MPGPNYLTSKLLVDDTGESGETWASLQGAPLTKPDLLTSLSASSSPFHCLLLRSLRLLLQPRLLLYSTRKQTFSQSSRF